MSFAIETEAPRILRFLAKAMRIDATSLCICGTGDNFGECCEAKSGRQLAFTKGAFQAVLAYQAPPGRTVARGIPGGLFRQFERASQQRLLCAYPGCGHATAYCHLVPENILRSQFGGHCLEYKHRDGSLSFAFIRTGVGRAGALHVFCSRHDNTLFEAVDDLHIDSGSRKQLFLLAFKSIAFSLRRVQQLLGVDFQVEIFKPWLISRNEALRKVTDVNIDISFLHMQYRRFTITNDVFMHALQALENQRWDHFSYCYRDIDYKGDIFLADLMNPSHDLEGRRINSRTIPINLTCNVWTRDGKLHVLFACPDGASRIAYAPFLDQLEKVHEPVFVNVVNTILTSSSAMPLLPLDFDITDEDLRRIKSLRQKRKECMNSASNDVFDLLDTGSNVSFVRT